MNASSATRGETILHPFDYDGVRLLPGRMLDSGRERQRGRCAARCRTTISCKASAAMRVCRQPGNGHARLVQGYLRA